MSKYDASFQVQPMIVDQQIKDDMNIEIECIAIAEPHCDWATSYAMVTEMWL